ncbi:MAG TPA: hypothetical protein ENM97_00445 [Moorella mulderi]|nr:hypothetical protein [Moorella mulderi]
MVQLLMGASSLNALMGKTGDALSILAIVGLNAFLGAYQESKADQALRALRQLEVPRARVIREGQTRDIEASRLVPGDIILLGSGDGVPADSRILEGQEVEADESCLTGESLPVPKEPDAHGWENCLFMGTSLTRSRAKALVCATGMATQMGHIAAMLQDRSPSPAPSDKASAPWGNTCSIYPWGPAA